MTLVRLLRSQLVVWMRRRLGGPAVEWTMEAALARAASRFPIRTIIDVGASNGVWARTARRSFPDASILLIEAQRDPHEPELIAYAESDPKVEYVIAAAGNETGEVHFDTTDAFGGAASQEPFVVNDLIVPMTTIDAEVLRRGLVGPFLVKLDTHGFETEILSGAMSTLGASSVLIIEAYNFELRPGVLRFHELCTFLEPPGFRPIDLADPMHRPKDRVLWQMDLVFTRADLPEFADAGYS